jgi:hypothetical protein
MNPEVRFPHSQVRSTPSQNLTKAATGAMHEMGNNAKHTKRGKVVEIASEVKQNPKSKQHISHTHK